MKFFGRDAVLALQLAFLVTLWACQQPAADYDTLTEDEKRLPENAVLGLEAAAGLQVKLMASEPQLVNPTNIDVDDRGRVWVTEAYNYRPALNGNPTTDAGDRILIFEDTDHNGTLDKQTVFYQGPEINAPLGICVLGNRVIVSQSPYVWDFYDDDGDGKADRKEILFQGTGGEQHDHGVHAFVFGPDGKLYFNFGNECHTLQDREGNVVRDQDGDEITNKKYRQGMVFRCDIDGTNVEVLGHNFRNPYELAVDSYGTIWQSDNDDDGNRGVRINYVMEYGNYGYTDELTGAGWRKERVNLEDSIPLQHWHLNDPGVIPNLLQTGAGSPTGIVVYEGAALPAVYRNQLIHADAGPNVIRSYAIEKEGAGYHAELTELLRGKDRWFRPSDVCIAPDGSLILADWYDPGVGGHQAGDQTRGRIYRVAPSVSEYQVPAQDYSTIEGSIAALQSPNLAVRYKAWTSLVHRGKEAIPALEKLFHSQGNDRMRARALWLLTKIDSGDRYLLEGRNDDNPDIRIVAIRAARQAGVDLVSFLMPLVEDSDMQVKRECALALRHVTDSRAAALWAKLAGQHEGRDRWYLEALGIGAAGQWDSFFDAFLQGNEEPMSTSGGRDVIWRSRTEAAIPILTRLAVDNRETLESRLRYFRAFDFMPEGSRSDALFAMLTNQSVSGALSVNGVLFRMLDPEKVLHSAPATRALHAVLDSLAGTAAYLSLVDRYNLAAEIPALSQMITVSASPEREEALGLLFRFGATEQIRAALVAAPDSLVVATGTIGTENAVGLLRDLLLSPASPAKVKMLSAAALGRSERGEEAVLALLQSGAVREELVPELVEGLRNTPRVDRYTEARRFLPDSERTSTGIELEKGATLTSEELLAASGDPEKGSTLFQTHCALCHEVNGKGHDFGPKLSQIGAKLPKTALLDAIVDPTAGISFGYETSSITLKDGSELMGIVSSRTETEVEVRFVGGVSRKLMTRDIVSIEKKKVSLMPPLAKAMSKGDLIDLIEYLASLK